MLEGPTENRLGELGSLYKYYYYYYYCAIPSIVSSTLQAHFKSTGTTHFRSTVT